MAINSEVSDNMKDISRRYYDAFHTNNKGQIAAYNTEHGMVEGVYSVLARLKELEGEQVEVYDKEGWTIIASDSLPHIDAIFGFETELLFGEGLFARTLPLVGKANAIGCIVLHNVKRDEEGAIVLNKYGYKVYEKPEIVYYNNEFYSSDPEQREASFKAKFGSSFSDSVAHAVEFYASKAMKQIPDGRAVHWKHTVGQVISKDYSVKSIKAIVDIMNNGMCANILAGSAVNKAVAQMATAFGKVVDANHFSGNDLQGIAQIVGMYTKLGYPFLKKLSTSGYDFYVNKDLLSGDSFGSEADWKAQQEKARKNVNAKLQEKVPQSIVEEMAAYAKEVRQRAKDMSSIPSEYDDVRVGSGDVALPSEIDSFVGANDEIFTGTVESGQYPKGTKTSSTSGATTVIYAQAQNKPLSDDQIMKGILMRFARGKDPEDEAKIAFMDGIIKSGKNQRIDKSDSQGANESSAMGRKG